MAPCDERPLLATGELVESYRPLFVYVSVAVELGRHDAREAVLLRSSDLQLVGRLVEAGNLTLDRLLDVLAQYFRSRVDPEVATKALTSYLGYRVDAEYAIAYYSRLLASWTVEAASSLNIIRLRVGGAPVSR